MLSDFKYALRMLAKSPAFTTIAVLTLALGIGANSAIFSVVDTVLLRPLPFPKSHELVAVWGTVSHTGGEKETDSFPNYVDLRDQSQTLDSLTAYTRAAAVLTETEESREILGLAVTSDVFRVLGVSPVLGRAFTREDDNPNARVIVFTHHAWKTLLNGDPKIIGKQIKMTSRFYTVLGIMPPGFQFPVEGERAEYFMPLHPLVSEEVKRRDSHFLRLVGRMKPGVSIEQCNAELNAISSRLAKEYPETNTNRSNLVVGLHKDIVGDVRPALVTVLAAVLFVLLIACANVANLLLARATARQREIAIRAALGASRWRIICQLLLEGFLLALVGALGGLLIAWWGMDLLRVFGPQDVPRLGEIAINAPVWIFTFAAAVLSTLIFALIPALQVTRPNVSQSLQEGGGRGAVGPESHRLRGLLVISQVALSLLLLVGAGLLIKSFANLRATKPGFDPSHAVTLHLSLPKVKYPDPNQHREFFEQILPKLATIPGVEAAGGAMPMPFSGNDRGSSFTVAGQPPLARGNHPIASHLTITPGYFHAMKTPLLAGRDFNLHDTKDSMLVVIVNEAFVRRFLGGRNPIAQRIVLDQEDNKTTTLEIVGVVASSHHETLAAEAQPEFYIPHTQDPTRRMDIVLRTSAAELSGLQAAFRNVVQAYDKDIYIPALETLEQRIGTTLAQPRFNMMLLGTFAGVAMILAAIGIYGVIAYSVAQRTREIGIRMALGAQRRNMLQMILWQSFSLVGIGLFAGLLGALGLARLMTSLLYGVTAHDLSIYAIVLIVLSSAALLASYFPARRAMQVDPMVALRYE
jgi:putative ABC transport system permease protein